MIFYSYDETNVQYDWIEIDEDAEVIRYGNSSIVSPDTQRFEMVKMEDLQDLKHVGTEDYKRIDAYTDQEMKWVVGNDEANKRYIHQQMELLALRKARALYRKDEAEKEIADINITFNTLKLMDDHTEQ